MITGKYFRACRAKVTIGDITVRDGFQHLEKFISTRAKIFYLEQLIFAGCRNIEVTNLGNPYLMPQFSDAEDLLRHLRSDRFKKRCQRRGINYDDIELTAITIREAAVDRAIALRQDGIGPDRILMMVSTEEEHHFANSGTTLPNYWNEAQRCIQKCHDAGIKMCGTVSTIWGSPIGGATDLKDAVEFTKRWLEIGADDIEHADHDGSASAPEVYRYFSMILDEIPDTRLHIAHFHETKRVAAASFWQLSRRASPISKPPWGDRADNRQTSSMTVRFPVPANTTTTIRAMWDWSVWKTCWCKLTRWEFRAWLRCGPNIMAGPAAGTHGGTQAALRSSHQRPHPEGGAPEICTPRAQKAQREAGRSTEPESAVRLGIRSQAAGTPALLMAALVEIPMDLPNRLWHKSN
jgi:hypothetical protein